MIVPARTAGTPGAIAPIRSQPGPCPAQPQSKTTPSPNGSGSRTVAQRGPLGGVRMPSCSAGSANRRRPPGGGWAVGCSIDYDPANRGCSHVLLVERDRPTLGATRHAGGPVGQLHGPPDRTRWRSTQRSLREPGCGNRRADWLRQVRLDDAAEFRCALARGAPSACHRLRQGEEAVTAQAVQAADWSGPRVRRPVAAQLQTARFLWPR